MAATLNKTLPRPLRITDRLATARIEAVRALAARGVIAPWRAEAEIRRIRRGGWRPIDADPR